MLLIVGHGCFLDILLNPSYLCLPVKIFSCLCSYFWGGNFKMHFLREQFWCVAMFWKIKRNFQHKATVWLNLVSDILFVKIKKTKIQLIFIFLILYLHCWYTSTMTYVYNFIFSILNKTANTTKCNREVKVKNSLFLLIKIGSTSVTEN